MRDAYFYKSLFSTIFVFCVITAFLMVFVAVTGVIGGIFILVTVIFLLVYFYDGFKKIKNIGKYTSN